MISIRLPHPARRRHLLSALCLLLAFGCRSGAKSAVAADGFAIGLGAVPGSPGYANVLRGLELAVERLNEGKTVRFRLRVPDSGTASAVQLAQQLRDDPTVIGVVGNPESGHSIETVPIYADAEHGGRAGVVAVSPTASSPRLSGISPWFFRVAPSDEDAARYTARWVRDTLGARRAAIIYRNNSYGRDWSETFAEAFTDSTVAFDGARPGVSSSNPYLSAITEWEAYAKLLAMQKPDVLLFPGDASDALELLRALKTEGVTIPFVGGDGTEGIKDSPDAVGARFVAFFRADRATSKEAVHFLKRYRDKYGGEPDMFAALSYDAAIVIGRTVTNGARTRLALRIALERVGNDTPAVDGVAGPIAFHSNHDIKGRSVVIARGTRPTAASSTTAPTAAGAN